MLYSIGKDSSVLLRLAQKAFYPGPIPFPAAARRHDLQVPRDDRVPRSVHGGDRRAADRAHQRRRRSPTERSRSWSAPSAAAACSRRGRCSTRSRPAASTRRSAARAATRSGRAPRSASSPCATRRASGIPKRQRPELWHLLNSRVRPGESIRVFPLSNWTEIDVWQYIHEEQIPVVPLYFAKEREVIVRGDVAASRSSSRSCRCCPGSARRRCSAGCGRSAARRAPGAIRSDADTVPKIIEELVGVRATPSASCASSTTTRTARWRSRSARATSDVGACSASARPAASTTARAR